MKMVEPNFERVKPFFHEDSVSRSCSGSSLRIAKEILVSLQKMVPPVFLSLLRVWGELVDVDLQALAVFGCRRVRCAPGCQP